MKVNVDFSVFSSPTKADGNVAGIMEFNNLPCVGDVITFLFPKNRESMPDVGFNGILKVEERRFDPGGDVEYALSLSDVVVNGASAAENLMQFFENGFGFFCYRYD